MPHGYATCADCGTTCTEVIGPVGLATCIPCRQRYARRLDRITPPINKVIDQYARGLITPDEMIAELVVIGSEGQ
jgi:hypothetical protein